MLVKTLKQCLTLRVQVELFDRVVVLLEQAFHIDPS